MQALLRKCACGVLFCFLTLILNITSFAFNLIQKKPPGLTLKTPEWLIRSENMIQPQSDPVSYKLLPVNRNALYALHAGMHHSTQTVTEHSLRQTTNSAHSPAQFVLYLVLFLHSSHRVCSAQTHRLIRTKVKSIHTTMNKHRSF